MVTKELIASRLVFAYADNVAVFCSDAVSVMETILLTKEFCNATGTAVNWGNGCGVWHAMWNLRPQFFAVITWESTPCTYLGVPLEYCKSSTPYWTEVAKVLKSKADTWENRGLSIFASYTVQYFSGSKNMVYFASLVPPTRQDPEVPQSVCHFYLEVGVGRNEKGQPLPESQGQGPRPLALFC